MAMSGGGGDEVQHGHHHRHEIIDLEPQQTGPGDGDQNQLVLVIAVLTSVVVTLCVLNLCNSKKWKKNYKSYRRLVKACCGSGSGSLRFGRRDARPILLMFLLLGFIVSLLVNEWRAKGVSRDMEYLVDAEGNKLEKGEEGKFYLSRGDLEQGKVVVVTTTEYNMVQIPSLIRMAQALYPVKDDVVWVVVDVTRPIDLIRKPQLKKNESKYKMRMKFPRRPQFSEFLGSDGHPKNNESRLAMHLSIIDKKLTSFGIPYVLLKNKNLNSTELNMLGMTWNANFLNKETKKDKKKPELGLANGILWALQYIDHGVIMLSNIEFTYNTKIFREVKLTRIASTWAAGLGKTLGFSGPISRVRESNTNRSDIMGYVDGSSESWKSDTPMEVGTYAVRIEFIRQNPQIADQILKMAKSGYTLGDLTIESEDVQALPTGGRLMSKQILIWRTQMRKLTFPDTLRFKPSYLKTSLVTAWENIFTIYYDQIPVDPNYRDKVYLTYY